MFTDTMVHAHTIQNTAAIKAHAAIILTAMPMVTTNTTITHTTVAQALADNLCN